MGRLSFWMGIFLQPLSTMPFSRRVAHRRAAGGLLVTLISTVGLSLVAAMIPTSRLHTASGVTVGRRMGCPVTKAKISVAQINPQLQREFFDNYTQIHQAEANRFQTVGKVGSGWQASVAKAIDMSTGEPVALKKVRTAFDRPRNPVRALREIKLMRLLGQSDDIVSIKHVLPPASKQSFTVLFFAMELADGSAAQWRKALSGLDGMGHRDMMYQLLRGLHYMHSAGVYHRDLKPANIFVDSSCKYKLGDLGLARMEIVHPTKDSVGDYGYLTGSGPARRYRSPELIQTQVSRWTAAMDIWALACAFVEIVTDQSLFQAATRESHVTEIVQLTGSPAEEVLSKYSTRAKQMFRAVPRSSGRRLSDLFPRKDPGVLRMAQRMLDLDPDMRPSALELLQDEMFAGRQHGQRPPDGPSSIRREFQALEASTLKYHAGLMRELIFMEGRQYSGE